MFFFYIFIKLVNFFLMIFTINGFLLKFIKKCVEIDNLIEYFSKKVEVSEKIWGKSF